MMNQPGRPFPPPANPQQFQPEFAPQYAGPQNPVFNAPPPQFRPPARQPDIQQIQPPNMPRQLVQGLSDDELLALQSALISEYRSKHPELNEFELYITAEVNTLLESAKRNGIFIPPKEAIEFGIQQFKRKFQKAIQAEQKKLAQLPDASPGSSRNPAAPQSRDVNRLALNMDLGSNPASVAKLSPDDIWNMPREQFLELDRKIRRQHYR